MIYFIIYTFWNDERSQGTCGVLRHEIAARATRMPHGKASPQKKDTVWIYKETKRIGNERTNA